MMTTTLAKLRFDDNNTDSKMNEINNNVITMIDLIMITTVDGVKIMTLVQMNDNNDKFETTMQMRSKITNKKNENKVI